MKTITILVSPQGDAKIEAHGFEEGECRLATAKLRAALGQNSSEHFKPEFSQQVSNTSKNLVTGGPIAR
jgi:hypothetical protein